MQAVVCPHCRVRVIPSAEGICPGCRRDVSRIVAANAEVIEPEPSMGASGSVCPGCNAPLPPAAVLCVACGYHLPSGSYLSTSVERRSGATANPFAGDPVAVRPIGTTAPSSNPYAAPSIPAVQQITASGFVSELTPPAVRQAAAIASEAEMLVWTLVLGMCICLPVLLLMFPWYGFRLICWYRLNGHFSELREPNGFSPHCQTAIRFQDALVKLWVGTILGAAFWAILAMMVVVQWIVELSNPAFR